ncbi:conserved hypothetical protein [Frankia sp. Hr75.2]|nr:conserved hypothetical protein [Frankia sp. Hr75.2]
MCGPLLRGRVRSRGAPAARRARLRRGALRELDPSKVDPGRVGHPTPVASTLIVPFCPAAWREARVRTDHLIFLALLIKCGADSGGVHRRPGGDGHRPTGPRRT